MASAAISAATSVGAERETTSPLAATMAEMGCSVASATIVPLQVQSAGGRLAGAMTIQAQEALLQRTAGHRNLDPDGAGQPLLANGFGVDDAASSRTSGARQRLLECREGMRRIEGRRPVIVEVGRVGRRRRYIHPCDPPAAVICPDGTILAERTPNVKR
jgi:hypothetical protein